ncbi:MAG: hypothetical protein QM724_00220 [Flavobacteriales bacterium]
MQLVYEREMDEGMQDDQRSLVRIIPLADRFVVFTSKEDKAKERTDLFAHAYARSDYSPLGASRLVASLADERHRSYASFAVGLLADNKVIAIRLAGPYNKSIPASISFKFLDLELNEILEPTSAATAKVERTIPQGISVDEKFNWNDSSSTYIGHTAPAEYKGHKVSPPQQAFVLLAYPQGSAEGTAQRIEHPGTYFLDMTCAQGMNSHVLCTGLYADKPEWTATGAFFLEVDPGTGAIVRASFKPMTWGEGDEDARNHLRVDRMMQRADHSWMVIGEQSERNTTCTDQIYSNGDRVCNTQYMVGNSFVFHVEPGGEVGWLTEVPKRQRVSNTDGVYAGCAFHQEGDRLILLYNDDPANLDSRMGKKPKNFTAGNDAVIVMATVEPDGSMHREQLQGMNRPGLLLKPAGAVDRADGRWAIGGG